MTPQDGDVVIQRERQSSLPFTVRQLPGEAQIGASTLEDAVDLVRPFARSCGVDVWLSDGERLRRLAAFRLGGAAHDLRPLSPEGAGA